MSVTGTEDEQRPLLSDVAKRKKPTPLPKFQIAILMLLHLAEPMTSTVIFPFINQASGIISWTACLDSLTEDLPQLVSELDITGGDEKKVGYYAGLIVTNPFSSTVEWS